MNNFQSKRLVRAANVAIAVSATWLGASSVGAQTAQVPATGSAAASKADRVAVIKATATSRAQLDPNALGDFSKDNVYTAVTPCRIVDTRVAGGTFGGGTTRTYDVDGGNLASQGGSPSGCAIPFNTASAVAMTVTVVSPANHGYLTAWGLGSQPFSSVLNYFPGQITANTTIVPVVPGAGNDFSIFSSTNTEVIIDVVGYFAAPAPTSHSIAALAGTWTATLTGFTGCGNAAMHINYTLNTAGAGTGTLTSHGSCGDTVAPNQTFVVQSLGANGAGTANLSCGAGCGWNLRIQVSPDRQVMNLVDVDPANPGNYIGGVAVRQ